MYRITAQKDLTEIGVKQTQISNSKKIFDKLWSSAV